MRRSLIWPIIAVTSALSGCVSLDVYSGSSTHEFSETSERASLHHSHPLYRLNGLQVQKVMGQPHRTALDSAGNVVWYYEQSLTQDPDGTYRESGEVVTFLNGIVETVGSYSNASRSTSTSRGITIGTSVD